MNKKTTLRVLQITDMHLVGDPNQNFLGINPYNHFVAIIENAAQHKKADAANLLLLTGDISQDFSVASYKHALTMAEQLNIPYETIAGNHDDPNLLEHIMYPQQNNKQKSLTYDTWQIILLNSHWPQHISGRLNEQEMAFLQQELDKNRTKNIVIFLHHHVLPLDASWLDRYILMDAERLLSILAQQHNVKAVFSGHVHQEMQKLYQNIMFYTTPAVAWQFTPHSPQFRLDTTMPGYRIIDLQSDGTYDTKIIRLDYHADFIPPMRDQESGGY